MQFVTRVAARQRAFQNSDIAYVAITRFNIHRPEVAARNLRIPAGTPEWCQERAEGFNEFCLPPMLHQRLRPLAWFILFDREVNQPVRQLLDDLSAFPWIIPLFLSQDEAVNLVRSVPPLIREKLHGLDARYICGVRLDSDDSLNTMYFAALDAAISGLREGWNDDTVCCINFPYGVLREGDKYAVYLSEKQYFGLVEPYRSFKTPYQRKHRQIDQVAPVVDVYTESPMWLYHRHTANVGKINIDHFERFLDSQRIVQHFGFEDIPESWSRLQIHLDQSEAEQG